MMINPMQLIQMLRGGQSARQLVTGFIQQQGQNSPLFNNPILRNAVNLAQNGNFSEMENVARNIAATRGINYEQALSDFQRQLGLFK